MTATDLIEVAKMADASSGPEGAGCAANVQRGIARYLELTAPLDEADPMQMSAHELDLLTLRNELLGRP